MNKKLNKITVIILSIFMCCSFIFGVKTKKTIKPNNYKTTNPLIIYNK